MARCVSAILKNALSSLRPRALYRERGGVLQRHALDGLADERMPGGLRAPWLVRDAAQRDARVLHGVAVHLQGGGDRDEC